MTDALIVTGPVNATQLGVPKDAEYHVLHIHPKGSDIGSTAMGIAAATWLGGLSIRDRVEKMVGPVDRIGVAWFSAGHGSVRSILKTSKPESVAAWICIDGLYGSNEFAVELAESAMRGDTSLLATASVSTPGQYDHSLDRWRDVAARVEAPLADGSVATGLGLPPPAECWSEGRCLIAGYPDIGHGAQVPAMRDAALRWWDSPPALPPGLNPATPPVTPFPVPVSQSPGIDGWLWFGGIAVAAGLGYLLLKGQKVKL